MLPESEGFDKHSRKYLAHGMDKFNLFLVIALWFIANNVFAGHMWSDFVRQAKEIEKVLKDSRKFSEYDNESVE